MSGLYVHIPLCHSKCAYCDFHSAPVGSAIGRYVRERYIDALVSELVLRRAELNGPLTTIYFGGGTPSILSAKEIARLLESLDLSHLVEFTVEANPEDISLDLVRDYVSIGVNRLSLGVQSLNDNELAFVGRRHSAKCALDAIDAIHSAGVSNISADLIYGLPEQTVTSWQMSLSGLLSTGITHLSAYSLSYEPHTRLSAMLAAGRVNPIEEEVELEMYNQLLFTAEDAGMEHYEISNFAMPGHRAIHNSKYWSMEPYLGLGPGAHSFDGVVTRRSNPQDSRFYVDELLQNHTVFDEEAESTDDLFNDFILTSLRTKDGVSLQSITHILGRNYADRLLERALNLISSGKLLLSGDYLHIPQEHWFVSDSIIRHLML